MSNTKSNRDQSTNLGFYRRTLKEETDPDSTRGGVTESGGIDSRDRNGFG